MNKFFIIFSLLFSMPLFGQVDEDSKGPMSEAAIAMRQRRFLEAELIYRSIVDKNPDDLTVKQLLCHALMNQKKYNEADSMLRKMVEADTNNAGNYWYMGLSAERQAKNEWAIHWFKTYLLKTKNANAQDPKGWLHVASGYRRMMHDSGITKLQGDDMIYHYEKYIQLNPTDPNLPLIHDFLEAVKPRLKSSSSKLIWTEQD